MKHKLFFKQAFAFLGLALAIVLAFEACSNPAGGVDEKSIPGKKEYEYVKGGSTYKLTITQKSTAKAAEYTPAAGDNYVLLIITGTVTQKSSGTVVSYSTSGVMTLRPSSSADSTASPPTFSVTISTSSEGTATVTKITGTITVEGTNGSPATTVQAPDAPTTSSGGGGGGGGGGGKGGGSGGGSIANTTKSIIITGLPAEDLTGTRFTIFVGGTDGKCAAMGSGQLSGSTVTFDLYATKYNDNGSWNQTLDRWAGIGTFNVDLGISKSASSSYYKYGRAQNINITTSPDITIQASQFQFDYITQGGETFTSVAAFETWLNAQPSNTESNPYNVALNISSLNGLKPILFRASNKYVSLDFSGSTFTSIGDYAFCDEENWTGCETLVSVTIPGSVTSIGDGAFGTCTRLASVTIPDSVTSIGDYAFLDCISLASVSIPSSVTSIGDGAFGSCTSLASVTIPSSVTSIGWYAFNSCISLVSVTIPNSVTSIRQQAFGSCTSLASVTIPSSVTSIGDWAFYGCKSLTAINVDTANTAYSSQDGVLYNKNKTILIQYPAGKTGSSFTIPSSVTSIGLSAFEDITSLASVTIPGSVASIGDYAFSRCTNLASVTFQGTIAENNFVNSAFPGDLKGKYLAGGIGTYIRPSGSETWKKR